MEPISTNDSATALVQNVNTEFGSSVISTDDSAAGLVSALNAKFEDVDGASVLLATDSATDFVTDLNDNFDLIDGGGEDQLPALRFLHISDTHQTGSSVAKCKELMDGNAAIGFTILTGDIHYSTYDSTIESLGNKLMLIGGNHDLYDRFSLNHANTVAWVRNHNPFPNAVYGGSDVSYWYRDIQLSSTRKLRIIALDQYDITDLASGYSLNRMEKAYSQVQLEWVAARMKELSPDDFLIMVTHEPPLSTNASLSGYGITEDTDENLFVSDYLNLTRGYWSDTHSHSVEHFLVGAMMHGTSLAYEVNDKTGSSALVYGGKTIDTSKPVFDFSAGQQVNNQPAKFLCHLCGHMHADIATYLREYPDQLMLLIDCAWASRDAGSDLSRYDNNNLIDGKWYCINDTTIDFERKELSISRIGGKYTLSEGRVGSRVRDSITFNWT